MLGYWDAVGMLGFRDAGMLLGCWEGQRDGEPQHPSALGWVNPAVHTPASPQQVRPTQDITPSRSHSHRDGCVQLWPPCVPGDRGSPGISSPNTDNGRDHMGDY